VRARTPRLILTNKRNRLQDEQVSITLISHSSILPRIEDEWNAFIRNHSANPFFLSEFVRHFLSFAEARGWTSTVLVFRTKKEIVGIAPLITKRMFGLRFARTLLHDTWVSDFVFEDKYREECTAKLLDFLFQKLHCQIIRLTLSGDSTVLRMLKKEKDGGRIQFSELPMMGRCVLYVQGNWAEFVESRGKKFRQDFNRAERRLHAAGSFAITSAKREARVSDAFERIFQVDGRSWKQAQRANMGIELDPDLVLIQKVFPHMSEKERDFNWDCLLLELNGQPVAYMSLCTFKEWAIFVKTSYDVRFRRLNPGIYLTNVAIRKLLDEDHFRKFDFLTDVPFISNWTSLCLPRVVALVSNKRLLSVILSTGVRFASSVRSKTILRRLFTSILAL
jgi:CelD/BcsL family acetyltransferase involved in cellulose biosynthesis